MHLRHPLLSALFAAALASLSPAAEPALPPGFTGLLKIDVHSHVFEDIPELNAMLRELNIRTVNVCNNGTDEYLDLMHRIAFDLAEKHPDLFPFESTFDLRRRDEPGYTADVIAWLDMTFRRGAVGVKIWKEIGIDIKDRNGAFILPDDPRFDPIYAFIAAVIGSP